MKFEMYCTKSVLILLLVISKVIPAVEPEDPCPSNLNHIVVDMCSSDSIVEDNKDGSITVDSVLLRITKQQNNCICHVSLQIEMTNYTIFMSKYEELNKAAPEQENCGLTVDVKYIDTSDTNRSLQSIECTIGTSRRSIDLGGNQLQLKSRIINGDFTRGYCMQISRDHAIYTCRMNDKLEKQGRDDDWIRTYGTQHTSLDECKKYCLRTDICVAVHYVDSYCFVYNLTTELMTKDGSTYSQKHCVDNQKLEIKCYPPWQDTPILTSQDTIIEDTVGNSQGSNLNTVPTIEKEEENIRDDDKASLPVVIVAVVGWCFTVFFAITAFCLYRRTCTAPSNISREQNAINQYEDLSASRLSSNYNSLNLSSQANQNKLTT